MRHQTDFQIHHFIVGCYNDAFRCGEIRLLQGFDKITTKTVPATVKMKLKRCNHQGRFNCSGSCPNKLSYPPKSRTTVVFTASRRLILGSLALLYRIVPTKNKITTIMPEIITARWV